MTLWYPGRVPFCTPVLISLLNSLIENIYELSVTHNSTYLRILEHIINEINIQITQENNECHGTDHILNTLRTLFENTWMNIQQAWKNNAFDIIIEIGINIQIVCDTLREEHKKIITNNGVKR